MDKEADKASIRYWIGEGWNRGKVDIADELFAPDFTADSMVEGSEELDSIVELKAYVRGIPTALPDIHFSIEHLVAESDLVLGVFSIGGTHKGELWGIPPTGRKASFKAVDVWHFRGGRVAERCVTVADLLRALQQVGVVPRFGQ